MHNHHLFLRPLSQRLNQILQQGYYLVSAFSQNKDELIMEFNNESTSFFIKAYLHPDFCCISFPTGFKRARKNSIDLFNSVLMKKVIRVVAFENERCFAIEFAGHEFLFFKMFGLQSNVILFQNGVVTEIFRNNFKNDTQLKLDAFKILTDSPFTNGIFYIIQSKDKYSLALGPSEEVVNEFRDPIQAVNEFFHLKVSGDAFKKEKDSALRLIQEKEKKTNQYLLKTRQEQNILEKDNHYQKWADLIMAHLYNIQKGSELVNLRDFETDLQIEVKLKKEISPQQNAAVYYRKAKNKRLEIEKLSQSITEKEQLLQSLLKTRAAIEKATTIGATTDIIAASGFSTKKKEESERVPFRMVEFKDYTILIGKSAKDNDELTLKYSHKDDLWLHAKDVSGSHVIVKNKSGKSFPKDVIERAAQLAAFHSKRRGESLCPVAYTFKKFVRKRKGDPAGLVVVEKETVILVEPKG